MGFSNPVPLPGSRWWRGYGVCVMLLAMLALTACESPPPDPTVRFTGSTMGTSYDLKLVPVAGQVVAPHFQSQVEALLARINQTMSTYDPDSELSRFNRHPSTDWVAVSPELQQIVTEALRVSELSSGAFDVTVGPLVNLWGFGPEPHRDRGSHRYGDRPSSRAGRLLAIAGSRRTASVKEGTRLISMSICPPWPRATAWINWRRSRRQWAFGNYLMSIGGEIRAKGHNGRGQPWTIAIEKPVVGQALGRAAHPARRS
jgi:thiamine biosynthesis lipoprotein